MVREDMTLKGNERGRREKGERRRWGKYTIDGSINLCMHGFGTRKKDIIPALAIRYDTFHHVTCNNLWHRLDSALSRP